MKVLLIEDDKELAWAVKTGLEGNAYVVDWMTNGIDGTDMACAHIYDIIILDIMLPLRDGFTVLKKIRNSKINAPILVLTARSQECDRVHGLDFGADDYMVKPFSYPELYARVRALIRRSNHVGTSLLTVGELAIDTVSKSVIYRKIDVNLKIGRASCRERV
jgi:DNA-binding response OmpR family regulator